jgi:hypothetical protein
VSLFLPFVHLTDPGFVAGQFRRMAAPLGTMPTERKTAYMVYWSHMTLKGRRMPKAHIRGSKLTISLPENVRAEVAVHDGDEIDIRAEEGRIVLIPTAEEPLPGDMGALDEAEAEFVEGKTRRLDDILHGRMGRTTK